MKRLVPILTVLALLAGCGESGPTDEEQIQSRISAFTNAMILQDQAAACDTFAPGLIEQFDYETLGCDQSVRPLGQPDDWQDLEVADVQIHQDAVANVTFTDSQKRKRQARDAYNEWLAAQMEWKCLVDNDCAGENRFLTVVPLGVDLIRYEGDWLIADFDVYQP